MSGLEAETKLITPGFVSRPFVETVLLDRSSFQTRFRCIEPGSDKENPTTGSALPHWRIA